MSAIAGPVRLIVHDAADGPTNMAIDEALLLSAGGSHPRPALRLYAFSPAAVSIGRFQSAADLRLEKLAEAGIGFVRRPTGGRAVLHDQELTYCFVMPRANGNPSDKRSLYKSLLPFLLKAVANLGLAAAVPAAAGGTSWNPDCFASSTPYEVETPGGGKLVGSAQAVTRTALLQHGSILLGGSARNLSHFLSAGDSFPDGQSRAADIESATGRKIGLAEAERTIAETASSFWRTYPDDLTAEERDCAKRLICDKYRTFNWSQGL